MANPKRRHAKSRRNKRRTHQKLVHPAVSICPRCRQPKLPHHICGRCGYYAGRAVEIKKGA